MEPAFYLSTWGRRWGFRLMKHLCRHVRITIIVIIGLARLLCVLACPFPLCATGAVDGCTSGLGVEVGPGQGRTHAPK